MSYFLPSLNANIAWTKTIDNLVSKHDERHFWYSTTIQREMVKVNYLLNNCENVHNLLKIRARLFRDTYQRFNKMFPIKMLMTITLDFYSTLIYNNFWIRKEAQKLSVRCNAALKGNERLGKKLWLLQHRYQHTTLLSNFLSMLSVN